MLLIVINFFQYIEDIFFRTNWDINLAKEKLEESRKNPLLKTECTKRNKHKIYNNDKEENGDASVSDKQRVKKLKFFDRWLVKKDNLKDLCRIYWISFYFVEYSDDDDVEVIDDFSNDSRKSVLKLVNNTALSTKRKEKLESKSSAKTIASKKIKQKKYNNDKKENDNRNNSEKVFR